MLYYSIGAAGVLLFVLLLASFFVHRKVHSDREKEREILPRPVVRGMAIPQNGRQCICRFI